METPFSEPQTYMDNFNTSAYYQTYYAPRKGIFLGEWTEFALRNLHETFGPGGVNGDTLIDFGAGPTIYHLLSAAEAFNNIITSDFLEQNRKQLEKWLRKDPDALDWTHIIKFVCELEGNRDNWEKKEETLRRKVTKVLKCDAVAEKPYGPVPMPEADCLISCLCLEAACKDLECFTNALKKLKELLKPGGVNGDTLIDFGAGPTIYHLLSAAEAFNNIITSDFLEQNRKQLEKWLRKDPDALDWTHIIKFVCELEGNRDNWEKKEETLRRKVTKVLKCDAVAEKPYGPVPMPEADCLISCLSLEAACKDLECFTNALKKLKELLKPGGHIVIQGVLNCTFYHVGDKWFSCLSFTKDEVEKAFTEAEYEVIKVKVIPRSDKSGKDITDNDSFFCVHARKPQK
ncbi:indolethylamine N-methyltransferase-like [Anomaloglossus baeobatrachus]|uniref:indolethylamine N-methyltransferase-like n=1 Tax=Anomaloglossus baeobatrachus TaxID=238106 RepID=UPI003F4FE461